MLRSSQVGEVLGEGGGPNTGPWGLKGLHLHHKISAGFAIDGGDSESGTAQG